MNFKSSSPDRHTHEKLQVQEPAVVQIDPEWCAQSIGFTVTAGPLPTPRLSLHLALKEFFEPLRTNDPRTDFFATYRKESADFDRDYARKYDEDLNTSLIFVSDPIQMHPFSTYSGGKYRPVYFLQSVPRS